MDSRRFDVQSKYRWPLLCPAPCLVTLVFHASAMALSPVSNPWYFSTKHATEIDCGRV